MEELINLVLLKMGVRHTSTYVKSLVKTQPYGGSLYAISYILGKFNIKASGVRIINKDSSLQDICPFICCPKKQWMYVYKIDDDTVFYYSEASPEHPANMPLSTFISMWDGTALIIEKTKYSEEPNYHKHAAEERGHKLRFIAIAVALSALIIAGITLSPIRHSFILYSQLALNFIGVYICAMLLQTQLDIPNKTATKICGMIKDSHCGEITKSDNHKIFGLISLGEIGYGYFVTNILCLLIIPDSVVWLAIISICAIPFTLWSIWYQKFKARQWCALCLITLAILWAQALTFLFNGTIHLPTQLLPGIIVAALYTLVICVTNIIMGRMADRQKIDRLALEYESLKSDSRVVKAFAADSHSQEITDDNCSALIFGNPEANDTLTVFSNPYCNPCALMHDRIKTFPGLNLKIRYVFSAFSQDLTEINRCFIAAYQQLGADVTWEMLTQWFANGKQHGLSFFEKFNLDTHTPDVNAEMEKHKEWIKRTSHAGTPTDYINGREISWPYTPEDYQYMI